MPVGSYELEFGDPCIASLAGSPLVTVNEGEFTAVKVRLPELVRLVKARLHVPFGAESVGGTFWSIAQPGVWSRRPGGDGLSTVSFYAKEGELKIACGSPGFVMAEVTRELKFLSDGLPLEIVLPMQPEK